MTKKFCTDAAGISLGLLKNEKVFQYPHCIVIENHIFQISFFLRVWDFFGVSTVGKNGFESPVVFPNSVFRD